MTSRLFKKEQRRAVILQVATSFFLERGYAGTSMSAIATRLGGSKGTLWSYFPSKEDLFSATLDAVIEKFYAEQVCILVPDVALDQAVRSFCLNFITAITTPDAVALHRLVICERPKFPEIGAIFVQKCSRAVEDLVAAYLQAHMTSGKLLRGDPKQNARMLLGMCRAGTHARLLLGGDAARVDDIEWEAENVAQVFLRAYTRLAGEQTSQAAV